MFRIKHKPTGLYYKPSKYHSRSNLSKTGKVYHTKPNISHYLEDYRLGYSYRECDKNERWNYKTIQTKLEDWEIIELKG